MHVELGRFCSNNILRTILLEGRNMQTNLSIRGGSRISGMGVHMYKGVGVCLALLIFLLN